MRLKGQMHHTLALLAWLHFFGCSVHAQREFFINSVTGNDSATCGEEASPCRTINHADSRAVNESANAILRLSGTFEHFNNDFIVNSGGWNQLIGDPQSPESVVIDGGETSERVLVWMYSDNNLTGPYYFDGIYFTGFINEAISLRGQHVDVRNCIFNFTDQFGGISIEALTLNANLDHPIAEESFPSNTSTLYVENVIVYNGANTRATSIFCRRCYNATIVNSAFYNSQGDTALHFEDSQNVYIDGVRVIDAYSCDTAAMHFENTANAVVKNIEVSHVSPYEDSCATSEPGNIVVENSVGVIEFDGVYMSDTTVGGTGSGIFLRHPNNHVIIRNAYFEDMVSASSGVIYVDASLQSTASMIELSNVTIVNSVAGISGGGIEFNGGGSNTTQVTMEDIHIASTSVSDSQAASGGAIAIRGDGFDIEWTGGSIVNCSAEFGGAIFMSQSVNTVFTMSDVTFSGNAATEGGAIFLGGFETNCYNCTFDKQNTAEVNGGCIYMPKGVGANIKFNLVDSVVSECTAVGSGGGLYFDGGYLEINDSVIFNSVAGLGGGMFVGNCVAHVHRSKIEANEVGGESFCPGELGYGGGVYFAEEACSYAHFEDVLLQGNIANVSGGAYFTQSVLCGEEWCDDCEFSDNEAISFGDTRSAPFARFQSEVNERVSVSVGEAFFVDAFPYDAFDQPMEGDHEVIYSAIAPPTDAEVFLCGDLSTTATQGLARFAFTIYVIDGEETTIRDLVNSNGADFSLFLEDDDEHVPVEMQFSLSACPENYELDFISESAIEGVLQHCMGSLFNEDVEIPALLHCQPVAHLSEAQQLAVLVVTSLTCVVGAVLVLTSVYYRNNRVVWSSSLFMMFVATLGYIALEIAALLRAFRAESSAMCMAWQWLFVLGLNLPLGSALAKNLRVWKIFTLKSLRVIYISNWKLVLLILVASIPEILTLTLQTTLYPLTIDQTFLNSTCESDSESTFLALYAIFKCLWLFAGVGIAYLVRAVPEKFNEWKSIALLVSATTFFIIVVWGIGGVLPPQQRIMAEVLTTAFVAALLMAIIFVPKLFLIYKKRDGTLLSATAGTNITATEHTMRTVDCPSPTHDGRVSTPSDPAKFAFKDRFNAMKNNLARTQKLYERSYENTQELQERFRTIESNLIALQFERDYRADVQGEDLSDVSDSRSGSGHEDTELSRRRKRSVPRTPAAATESSIIRIDEAKTV